MTSEDGMVYSPVHSIGYIIMAREEEETAMIREAKQKFRKVGINYLNQISEDNLAIREENLHYYQLNKSQR